MWQVQRRQWYAGPLPWCIVSNHKWFITGIIKIWWCYMYDPGPDYRLIKINSRFGVATYWHNANYRKQNENRNGNQG